MHTDAAGCPTPVHGEPESEPADRGGTAEVSKTRQQLIRWRRRYAALRAERDVYYQEHLTLEEVRRSRCWRMLSRLSDGKRWLTGLLKRTERPAASPGPTRPAPETQPGRPNRVGGPRVPSERRFRVAYILKPGVHDAAALRYRGFNLIEALQRAGVEAAHFDEDRLPAELARILGFDVIVLVRRPLSANVAALLDAADRADVPVLFDLDDYTFEEAIIPHVEWLRHRPPEAARSWVRGWRECLDRCAYFTGSTPYLVDRAAALGKVAFRVRNGLNGVQLELARQVRERRAAAPSDGTVRLGYFSGTRTHQADFRLVAPALVRVLDEFPHASLVVAGDFDLGEFPEFGRFGDRVESRPFVDWRALPAETGRVDVNLIPLVLNPFTEGKSDLKYYEAGMLAIPSVASPTEVLAGSIEHGVNGLLARTPEEWYRAVAALVADPELRRRLGQNACRHTLKEYAPEAVAREAVGVYRDVIRHRRRLGADADGLSITILVNDLARAVADRAAVLPLAAELVRQGAGVTLQLAPGERFHTAAEADRFLANRELELSFAIEVGEEISCCDALLATDAPTARRAHAFAHRAVRVARLVQDVEPDGGERVSRHGGAVVAVPAWAERRAPCAPRWAARRKLLVHVPGSLSARSAARTAEALNLIRRLYPDVEILQWGAAPPLQIEPPYRHLGSPRASEWETLLAEGPVCLAWSAGGAPRFVFDFLAAGCPVVVAVEGARGAAGLDPGKGFLTVPADPPALAAAVDAVFVNPVLQTSLVQRGLARTRAMPGIDESARTFLKLLCVQVAT